MHCVQTVQTVIVADPTSEWALIRITHLIWRKILKIEKNWILIQLLGHVKQAEEAGLSVTGFWIQDYSGQITTVFGQRVFWNWCWDPEHYPSRRFSYNFFTSDWFLSKSLYGVFPVPLADPRRRSNFILNFTQYSGKKNSQNNSFAFPLLGWHPRPEILDPPLITRNVTQKKEK